ncbi:hypothetical protein [Pseudarthrobacter sp. N5]|uniref:hypothetical protein n=1 Tax=Pseudarthrobacter sp. N5 TaxID=3418416 RepID=UPI003CFAFA78
MTTAVSGTLGSLGPAADSAPVPVTASSDPAASGLLQPVLDGPTGTADQLIAEVPVVNQVVPASTVTAVTPPVVSLTDQATGELVATVVPAVGDVAPVLDPVLQPVTDLVTGNELLQLPLPGTDPVVAPVLGVVLPPLAVAPPNPTDPLAAGIGTGRVLAEDPGNGSVLALLATGAVTSVGALAGGIDPPGSPDRNTLPNVLLPAEPGSGSGNGQPLPGPSGSAAWVSRNFLAVPVPGAVPVSGPLQHAPSPVSFDPGSSPD